MIPLQVRRFFEVDNIFYTYIRKKIDSHRSTYQVGEIRDFVDLYLQYEKEQKEHYTREAQ